jgi:hypothetical protein
VAFKVPFSSILISWSHVLYDDDAYYFSLFLIPSKHPHICPQKLLLHQSNILAELAHLDFIQIIFVNMETFLKPCTAGKTGETSIIRNSHIQKTQPTDPAKQQRGKESMGFKNDLFQIRHYNQLTKKKKENLWGYRLGTVTGKQFATR